MTRPNYRISNKAYSDLENIWLYTLDKWSIQQADRYNRLIISEIEFTSNNPSNGISRDQLKKGYRSTKVKSHLIFFKFGQDGILEVIRILHQRMDLKRRLLE